jgi:hypothetical protein
LKQGFLSISHGKEGFKMKAKRRWLGALIGGVIIAAALVGGCKHEALEPAASGAATGQLTISLGIKGAPAAAASVNRARTVYPGLDNFTKYELYFDATDGGEDKGPEVVESTGTSAPISLVVGTYTITATAYTGSDPSYTAVALGEKTGIVISQGATVQADITLGPKTGGSNGTLSYDIDFPVDVNTAALTITSETTETVNLKTASSGTKSLVPGEYEVNVLLTKGEDSAGGGEIVHIYSGLTSSLEREYTGVHFSEPTVVDELDLSGLFSAPVVGESPASSISGHPQYTGSITWSPGVSGAFAAVTAYTATVELTVRAGYTFTGVGDFSYPSATSVTPSANTGTGITLSIAFPATGNVYGASGVGLGFNYAALPVTLNPTSGTVTKAGIITLSIAEDAGYTDVEWYVDGDTGNKTQGYSLKPDTSVAKTHTVTVSATKDGKRYGQFVEFTVAESVAAGPSVQTSAATLAGDLAGVAAGSADNPTTLKFAAFDVSSNTWGEVIYPALAGNTKYLVLDLSDCTATKISGGYPEPSGNDFNRIKSEYIVGVILPDTLVTLGTGALRGFTGIKSMSISAEIGAGAFADCTSLESVIISAGVSNIANGAFAMCSNLKSVTLQRWEAPSTITKLANIIAFDGTHADLKIYVPSTEAQTVYKAALRWSTFADQILVSP